MGINESLALKIVLAVLENPNCKDSDVGDFVNNTVIAYNKAIQDLAARTQGKEEDTLS